jgi:hypothetical protein
MKICKAAFILFGVSSFAKPKEEKLRGESKFYEASIENIDV